MWKRSPNTRVTSINPGDTLSMVSVCVYVRGVDKTAMSYNDLFAACDSEPA